jgi:prepilin-type N-terminal cleavage/methylation domain-containing protein
MTASRPDAKPAGRPSGAFTLIELLTVIAVLGILVTILVPSVVAVKTASRKAYTSALLSTLSDAVNTFMTDEVVGKRTYPPSQIDTGASGDPYGNPGYTAYGAQTLVWAVAGADLGGTPGFDPKSGDNLRDMYTPTSKYPRRGPFVETSNLRVVKPDDEQCRLPWNDLSAAGVHAGAPVILDAFGLPVLYYKVKGAADFEDLRYDNAPFTELDGYSKMKGQIDFERFMTDTRAAQFATGGGDRPYMHDSFILLSAGANNSYGPDTSDVEGATDDIANFDFNR